MCTHMCTLSQSLVKYPGGGAFYQISPGRDCQNRRCLLSWGVLCSRGSEAQSCSHVEVGQVEWGAKEAQRVMTLLRFLTLWAEAAATCVSPTCKECSMTCPLWDMSSGQHNPKLGLLNGLGGEVEHPGFNPIHTQKSVYYSSASFGHSSCCLFAGMPLPSQGLSGKETWLWPVTRWITPNPL